MKALSDYVPRRPADQVKAAENRRLYKSFIPCNLQMDQTERELLGNPSAFDRVIGLYTGEIKTDCNGIFEFGSTGKGKTRAMAAILDSASRGTAAIECWSWVGLKREFARLATSKDKWAGAEMEDLIDRLKDADHLFLDDCWHVASDYFLEHMRDVFESFSGTLIMTSNYNPARIQEKWRKKNPELRELLDATLRRIVEQCEFVDFDLTYEPVENTPQGES